MIQDLIFTIVIKWNTSTYIDTSCAVAVSTVVQLLYDLDFLSRTTDDYFVN